MPIFIKKNIELYEMICVRHGLMVVGPTGGGKSSNVRTLQRALTMLKNDKIEGIKYEKVDIHHLNPKSITMGQLYGADSVSISQHYPKLKFASMASARRHATATPSTWP